MKILGMKYNFIIYYDKTKMQRIMQGSNKNRKK